MTAELLLWIALLVIGYTYLLYPAIVVILAALYPATVRKSDAYVPTISVAIAAHNEAARIAVKVQDCLALDYPPEQLEVIVVSDGSSDDTAAILDQLHARVSDRVKVASWDRRRGKASALNVAASLATGEILLLADTRQTLDSRVARMLARNFADPGVGAVSGELLLLDSSERDKPKGLGLYWRYEKVIRRAEAQLGSCIGFTGAVSAVRRNLFSSLPLDTLVDDLVIPLRVVSRGFRVVFEPMARATDQVSDVPGREFARKVRTLGGVVQTLIELPRWVGPLPARIWWQFMSHKILRLLVPYALAAAFVANLMLSGRLYQVTLAVQTSVYTLGVLGLFLPKRASRYPFLATPATFLMLNWAAVVGPIYFLSGHRLGLWQTALPGGTARV